MKKLSEMLRDNRGPNWESPQLYTSWGVLNLIAEFEKLEKEIYQLRKDRDNWVNAATIHRRCSDELQIQRDKATEKLKKIREIVNMRHHPPQISMSKFMEIWNILNGEDNE